MAIGGSITDTTHESVRNIPNASMSCSQVGVFMDNSNLENTSSSHENPTLVFQMDN